jgi:hypothetical protein
MLLILVLMTLAACGGSSRVKKSDAASPDPVTSNDDPGYPGYVDSGSDDGGSADPVVDDSSWEDDWDVAEEKTFPSGDVDPGCTLVEAVNYDAGAYRLSVQVADPGAKRRRLYLPPVPAAPPGGSARSARGFRFRAGSVITLVLEAQDGHILDVRSLDTSGGPSRESFMIVSAKLLESDEPGPWGGPTAPPFSDVATNGSAVE